MLFEIDLYNIFDIDKNQQYIKFFKFFINSIFFLTILKKLYLDM